MNPVLEEVERRDSADEGEYIDDGGDGTMVFGSIISHRWVIVQLSTSKKQRSNDHDDEKRCYTVIRA